VNGEFYMQMMVRLMKPISRYGSSFETNAGGLFSLQRPYSFCQNSEALPRESRRGGN